jgi:hypothetical protein
VPFESVRGEHLVPVVADPASRPAVPAAAGQTHRVGVGRSEERLGRGRTPVDQQLTTGAVPEAKPSDVHGLGVVRAHHVPEAQVQSEPAQGAQARGQPVDLHVPVHRPLADAARRLPLGIEAAGQVGDRLLEALRDGREMLLVGGDQSRVGLGREVVGKVKRAGRQRIHGISSGLGSWVGDPARLTRSRPAAPAGPAAARRPRAPRRSTAARAFRTPPFPQVPASTSDYAALPGSCGKPPGALYVESGGECAYPPSDPLLWAIPSPAKHRTRRRPGAGPHRQAPLRSREGP